MTAIKIRNLVVQLILTALALVINILAILPVFAILSGAIWKMLEENYSLIIILPMMFGIFGLSFVLNRLLFRLKGKKTDETYLAWFQTDVITDIDYNEYSNTLKVTYTPITYPGYTSRRTALGWLATFLAFIAFPLRLISLIMAFVALFTNRIFVTHSKLNDNMPIGKSAVFTHTLFDFVILPAVADTKGVKDKKSIIYVVLYVVLFFILNILAITFIGSIKSARDWAILVTLLGGVILLISDLILVIKHSVLICKDYDKKRGLINLLKIVALPLIWLIFNLICSFV